MRRFFVDVPSLDLPEITLLQDEAKHIARVLRMKEGDSLEIVNGQGYIFTGEITYCDPKNVMVKQLSLTQVEPDPFHIHIAIAPTKSNDRIEWFLEKATELGIHEISLVLCKNSERKKINFERYQKIIVSAMKQSKRVYMPKLNDLTKVEDFISNHPNGLIGHLYNETEMTTINKVFQSDPTLWNNQNIPILIGPEGDFTIEEVQLALKNGYRPITLGNTTLRTETAGVYACAHLKVLLED